MTVRSLPATGTACRVVSLCHSPLEQHRTHSGAGARGPDSSVHCGQQQGCAQRLKSVPNYQVSVLTLISLCRPLLDDRLRSAEYQQHEHSGNINGRRTLIFPAFNESVTKVALSLLHRHHD